MAQKYATRVELDELWQKACDFWDHLSTERKIDTPWVEAAFKIKAFKVALAQKGFRIPLALGG